MRGLSRQVGSHGSGLSRQVSLYIIYRIHLIWLISLTFYGITFGLAPWMRWLAHCEQLPQRETSRAATAKHFGRFLHQFCSLLYNPLRASDDFNEIQSRFFLWTIQHVAPDCSGVDVHILSRIFAWMDQYAVVKPVSNLCNQKSFNTYSKISCCCQWQVLDDTDDIHSPELLKDGKHVDNHHSLSL